MPTGTVWSVSAPEFRSRFCFSSARPIDMAWGTFSLKTLCTRLTYMFPWALRYVFSRLMGVLPNQQWRVYKLHRIEKAVHPIDPSPLQMQDKNTKLEKKNILSLQILRKNAKNGFFSPACKTQVLTGSLLMGVSERMVHPLALYRMSPPLGVGLKGEVHLCGHGFTQYRYGHAHWYVPNVFIFMLFWTSWACELLHAQFRCLKGNNFAAAWTVCMDCADDKIWRSIPNVL